jgi:hypothetical protein
MSQLALRELNHLKENIKSTLQTSKRYSPKLNEFGQILSQADKSDLCNDDWDLWAQKHGKKLTRKYTTNEIRQLRRWFLELDQDHSGAVSYNELVDPLLSAGLFKSEDEVRQLIRLADTDGSGEIDFNEFLTALSKDKICDQSKIATLQNITTKSKVGLSTAMKLSEERRKHLLGTVIDESTKRQEEIDQLYSHYNSSSSPSHSHSHSHRHSHSPSHASPSSRHSSSSSPSLAPLRSLKKQTKVTSAAKQFEMKLERVALSHHKQLVKSSEYLHSLEPIVSSHKTTIASDNVLDTTCTRDIYQTSVHTVMADPQLDAGYKGGVQGRRESLQRLKKIDLKTFGEGTSYQLRRGRLGGGKGCINEEDEEEEDYSQYDSHYTIYSPIEVTATRAAPPPHAHAHAPSATHQRHQGHQTAHPPLIRSSSGPSSKVVPKLPSLSSQRFSQSNLHADEATSSRCPSGRVTLRRQPISSRHLEELSPLPTGRQVHTQRSNSQSFFKQSSFKNLSQASAASSAVGPVAPAGTGTGTVVGTIGTGRGLPPLLSQRQGSDEFTDLKRRKRAVVKRFYRKISSADSAEGD